MLQVFNHVPTSGVQPSKFIPDEKAFEYGLSDQEQHQLRVLVMATIITELEYIWKAKF